MLASAEVSQDRGESVETDSMPLDRVLLVSHITDLSGPTEALERFLRERAGLLGTIYHPFHYCVDRRSRAAIYRQGRSQWERRRVGLGLPQVAGFFKDVLLTLYFFAAFKVRFDVFIGANPLNAVVGIVLKRFGLVRAVIFYTIDWMPRRFANRFLNSIYHAIDRLCVKNCDVSWNVSARIVEVRREQGLEDRRNILVPVGVRVFGAGRGGKTRRGLGKRLVLLGALAPSKGVDLVIDAYPALKEECPELELHVIGRTPLERVEDGVRYEPYEPRLASLGESVTLWGVRSHDEVMKMLPQFDVGLALYKPDRNNLSRWADPSRIKDYLACGLPVIVTDVPEIAKEIEAARAGIVIEYTAEDLVRAVAQIYGQAEELEAMQASASAYIGRFEWGNVFEEAFRQSRWALT